jgi:hypothetical protein
VEPAETGAVVSSGGPKDLAEKYARILALRTTHDLARTTGGVEPDPREAMAALAARWPGALRELDELPLHTVRERLAALARVVDDPESMEPWMRAQLVFHREARAVLAAKRWLDRRRVVDAATRAAFGQAELDEATRAWADRLDEIAMPPRGRLLDLVWPEVARALRVTVTEARALVRGP